jgi:hypothetical protein
LLRYIHALNEDPDRASLGIRERLIDEVDEALD